MSTNESETTSLTYPKGPVGDYKLMSTDILKCLLKFGNTIMSKKTVKNAMDMIYMEKHGRHLPKNFQNDPVYKKQFNYCKKRICKRLVFSVA